MEVLQEDTVRQLHLKRGRTEIHIAPGTYVTQQARDYMKEKRLNLIVDGEPPENRDIRPAPEMAAGRFRTEDGKALDRKPEHMTHLHGNVLVPKTHPRIVLRGRLDSLEAEVICLQTRARGAGEDALAGWLGEITVFCRSLMCSEVTEKPLDEWTLLGLRSQELREQSQQPRKYFGIGHLLPDCSLGKWSVELNRLRALSRQTELAAAEAFVRPDGTAARTDLLEGYNRLSSAFYLLMLRLAAEREGERGNVMNEQEIRQLVSGIVTQLLLQEEQADTVPVEVSARHVHLTQKDVEALFGPGHTLTHKRNLSQPGQFLAEERVSVVTAKNSFHNVAVLGPARPHTQVELSMTDARTLGLKAPIRQSGDTKGCPDVCLMAGSQVICARESVMVAQKLYQ